MQHICKEKWQSKVVFLLAGAAFAFGLRADAATPDSLSALIDRSLAAGEKTIKIPKAVYTLDPGEVASIHLEGLKGVTIDFQGAELQGKVRSGMFRLDGCDGVTIKNAVIDYPHRLPFSQGWIREVAPDGTWDVEIAAGYQDQAGGWPIQVYDAKTGDLVNPMRMGGEKIKRTGKRRYSVTGGRDTKGKVGDIVVWSFGCETFGSTQSVSNRAHAVYLVNCKRCRIEDVTVYSTPGSNAFRELLGDGGNTYLRCKVIPREPKDDPVKRAIPRMRSGSHDAFNSRAMKVGPELIDCVARNHCDDCVNIHGSYQYVASANGRTARVFVKDMYAETIKVGEPVQLVTKDGRSPLEEPVIAAVRPATPTDAERAELRKGLAKQIASACNVMMEVTFDGDCDALQPGSLFVLKNRSGNGFTLKRCRFGPNRARGFICNASKGTVVGCVFDRLESYAVLSRPSLHWLEGGVSRNVRFKNCTFIDCGVFIGTYKDMETTSECHRNFVFAGCKFKGAKAKLDIRCCRGFSMDENMFDVPEDKAVKFVHVEDALVRRIDYGRHPKQYFMFMRPAKAKGSVPVKVYLHGGGMRDGYAIDHGIYRHLDSVADGSAALAAVQYRFLGETKEMGVDPPVKGVYDDCCDAIRYLKDHASELGIDPHRISLHGGSAGGYLMLLMALKDSNPLGLYEMHADIPQTTLDPEEVGSILPGYCHGFDALGVSRKDFARRRDELLPKIRDWSPVSLLDKADPKRLPPMHLSYTHRYPGGRVPAGSADDRVHDAAYGDLFMNACKKRGVYCTLKVGSNPIVTSHELQN